MADTLPNAAQCCTQCPDPVVTSIPGAQGDPCTPCNDGADGNNAWSLIDGSVVVAVPAYGAAATITLLDPPGNCWMAVGQIVFISPYGYFKVTGLVGTTQATVLNLGDGTLYPDNVDNTVNFAANSKVSPGGVTGPKGADGASGAPTIAKYIVQTHTVSLPNDVPMDAKATGLVHNLNGTGIDSIVPLGIAAGNVAPVDAGGALVAGRAVFAVAGGLETKTAANAQTALGLGSMSVQNANAVAITGGAISGITDLAVADGGTGASTATAAQDNLGKILPRYGLLGSLTAANLNVATSDNAITMRSARYRLDKVTVENASVNLTLATAGLFTAAGGGGTTLAADQALAALSASSKFMDIILQAVCGTDVQTAGTLYFRVGTAQGVAATANVWIWGWRLD